MYVYYIHALYIWLLEIHTYNTCVKWHTDNSTITMQLSSVQEQTGMLGPTHKLLIVFFCIGALHVHLSTGNMNSTYTFINGLIENL